MPIIFKCGGCHATIRVPEQFAGKKAHCPKCRVTVRIPKLASASAQNEKVADAPTKPNAPEPQSSEAEVQASELQEVPAELEVPAEPPPAPLPAAAKSEEAAAPESDQSRFITFPCPSCNRMSGFPRNQAGTAAVCAVCHVRIMVPERQGDPSFILASRPGAVSGIAGASGLTPATPKSGLPAYAIAIGGAAVAALIFALAFAMGRSSQPTVIQAPSQPIATAPVAPVAPPVQPVAPLKVAEAAPPQNTKIVMEQPAPPPPSADPQGMAFPALKPEEAKAVQQAFQSNAPQTNNATPAPPAAPAAVPAPAGTGDMAVGEIKSAPQTSAPAAGNAPAKDAPNPNVVDDTDTAPASTRAAKTNTGESAKTPDAPAPAKTTLATPPPAAVPVPLCPVCLGSGYIPNSPVRPFIRTGSERIMPATANNAVPWRFCPKCGATKDPQLLIAAETARLAAAAAEQKTWEDAAGIPLSFVETAHMTLRSTLAEAETKVVAVALEQLTTQLQQATQSVLLTQTRPDTDQMLIGGDKPGYVLLLDVLQQMHPKLDMSMAKDSVGTLFTHLSIFNAQHNNGLQARNMALYQFGEMSMYTATNGKAPAWLRLGFSSYCENVITHQNLCYAFQYEKNDVKFGENWDNEIKKFAAQSKLKTWDMIFNVEPVGMSALDYLTCYSMVEYLITTDPKLFPKLCAAFRDGLDSEHAIKKVYGSDSKNVQMMWANWAITK